MIIITNNILYKGLIIIWVNSFCSRTHIVCFILGKSRLFDFSRWWSWLQALLTRLIHIRKFKSIVFTLTRMTSIPFLSWCWRLLNCLLLVPQKIHLWRHMPSWILPMTLLIELYHLVYLGRKWTSWWLFNCFFFGLQKNKGHLCFGLWWAI